MAHYFDLIFIDKSDNAFIYIFDNPNAPRDIVYGIVNDSEAINLSFHFPSRGIFANAV